MNFYFFIFFSPSKFDELMVRVVWSWSAKVYFGFPKLILFRIEVGGGVSLVGKSDRI